MREQVVAARTLPFESLPQLGGIDRDQHLAGGAGKMLGGGLGDLRGRGEMDEAVAHIERRAVEASGLFGLPPQLLRTNLVDGAHPPRLPPPSNPDYGRSVNRQERPRSPGRHALATERGELAMRTGTAPLAPCAGRGRRGRKEKPITAW